jgi:hypothetical protein
MFRFYVLVIWIMLLALSNNCCAQRIPRLFMFDTLVTQYHDSAAYYYLKNNPGLTAQKIRVRSKGLLGGGSVFLIGGLTTTVLGATLMGSEGPAPKYVQNPEYLNQYNISKLVFR